MRRIIRISLIIFIVLLHLFFPARIGFESARLKEHRKVLYDAAYMTVESGKEKLVDMKDKHGVVRAQGRDRESLPIEFREEWLIGPGSRILKQLYSDEYVLIVTDQGIISMDENLSKLWSYFISNLVDAYVFDVDGDSTEEIIVGNATIIEVLSINRTIELYHNVSGLVDFLVGDFYGYPGNEYVLVFPNYIEVRSGSWETIWRQEIDNVTQVLGIQWNHDSLREILAVGEYKLLVIDDDGSIIWNYVFQSTITHVIVSEMNNNELEDIIACTCDNTIWLFMDSAMGKSSREFAKSITSVGTGNVDNTMYREILLGFNDKTLLAVNITLGIANNVSVGSDILAIQCYNVDLDQEEEIIVGCTEEIVFIDEWNVSWCTGLRGNITSIMVHQENMICGGLTDWIYKLDFEGNINYRNRIFGVPVFMDYADVVAYDAMELIVMFEDGTLTVLDEHGNELYTWFLGEMPVDLSSVDGDKDGYAEPLILYQNGTFCLLDWGTEIWRETYNGTPLGIHVEDIDADGLEDIIVAGDAGVDVFLPNGTLSWCIENLNISAIAAADIDNTFNGLEVITGLVNGSIVVLASNGSEIRMIDAESERISDVVVVEDTIIYCAGNLIKSYNYTNQAIDWSTNVGDRVLKLTKGDFLADAGLEIGFMSSSGYGIVMMNGSILYRRNATIDDIAGAHLNGSLFMLIAYSDDILSIDNIQYAILIEKQFDRQIRSVGVTDLDMDLMDEVYIGLEIGLTRVTAERKLMIMYPSNETIFSSRNIMLKWRVFGLEPIEYRIYANQTFVNRTVSSKTTVCLWADGRWNIEVETIPKRGTSISAIVVITVDTLPPSIRILNPQNNTYLRDENVSVIWNGFDNVSGVLRYELYLNGSLIYNGTREEANVTLYYGCNEITLISVDHAGNMNTTMILVIMDNIEPRITWTNVSNDTYLPYTTFVLVWSYEEDFLDHFEVRVDGGLWEDIGTDTNYTVESLDYGQHSIDIMIVDKAGNNNTVHIDFFVDDRKPVVTISGLQNNSYINTTVVHISYNVSEENLDYVVVLVDGKEMYRLRANSSKLTFSVFEGTHKVVIRAVDLANNSDSVLLVFSVDLTQPSVSVMSPINGSYYNISSINISWMASDDFSGIKKVLLKFGTGAWMYVRPNGSIVITLSDGMYEVFLKVEDNAGNSVVKKVLFFVDTEKPCIIITSPTNYSIMNTTLVSLEWLILDENFRYVFISVNGSRILSHNVSRGKIMVSLWGDGTYVFTIVAWDKAGNCVGSRIYLYVDTSPPRISVLRPQNGSTISNQSFRVEWFVDDAFGIYGYYIRIDNESWVFVDNRTWYEVETIPLVDGQHKLHIRAIDIAGNRRDVLIIFYILREKPPSIQEHLRLVLIVIPLLVFVVVLYVLVKKGFIKRGGTD